MSEETTKPRAATEMLVAPRFSVSGFNVQATPTEVTVLASSMVPGLDADGEVVLGQKPELILTLSPQAAKEFSVLLQGIVEKLEKDIGEIITPFLRERAEK